MIETFWSIIKQPFILDPQILKMSLKQNHFFYPNVKWCTECELHTESDQVAKMDEENEKFTNSSLIQHLEIDNAFVYYPTDFVSVCNGILNAKYLMSNM